MAQVHDSMFGGWSNFAGGGQPFLASPTNIDFGGHPFLSSPTNIDYGLNAHPLLSGGGYTPPPAFGGGGGYGGFGGTSSLPYPNAASHSDPFYAQVNSLTAQVGNLAIGGGFGGGGGGGNNGTLSQFAMGAAPNDPFYAQLDAVYAQVGALAGGGGNGGGGGQGGGYSDPFTPQIAALQEQWVTLMTTPPPPVPEVTPEQAAQQFGPFADIIAQALTTALTNAGIGGNSGSAGSSGTDNNNNNTAA